ncbi:hypothetical protein M441DRAFT_87647 [Trichoderma asperellum CBS 433.97]|uniref:Uncharacterized protein n=1 Tax=Trichoderma asperellum (strain ATCC 204424 / CBS 433.97 / NBRC 101777) TaxID=1042311 RepID=A0A2T3ZIT0_TRIA4|nr:hypothetical protein M441DRAFT_87647 [Trichoderma asperellum CBS 433.97]PTB44717.1 hypothetical protein M441DRAFT_87647 [Trichoderma asperellum CBS 433.97]
MSTTIPSPIMDASQAHSQDCRASPFLLLPYHIRHEIYMFVLEYPDFRPIFARMEYDCARGEGEHDRRRLPKCVLPTPHVPARLKVTPGIFLCNRQIAMEAREAMNFKVFTLRRPPPYTITLGRPMDITEFISQDTLKNMRRVELVMNLFDDARGWCKTVEILLDVWSTANHLKKIDISLEQPEELPSGTLWHERSARHVIKMLSMIQSFARECGIELTGTPLPALNVKKANVDL